MSNQEMTELFSVMLLAWPNAEMFKGGVAKLGPTVQLWTSCTKDIDFWTGQQAVAMLCKSSKFPPTIAEFRQASQAVGEKIQNCIASDWAGLRRCVMRHRDKEGSLKERVQRWYDNLPPGLARSAVDRMGGPQKLLKGEALDYKGFADAYRLGMRCKTALPVGQKHLRQSD